MKAFGIWMLAGFFLLTSGCGSNGPKIGKVSGTILLDQQPLERAGIVFQPVSGRPSYGMTDSAGNYTLEYALDTPGALVGRHTVIIRTRFVPEYPGDPKARPELVPKRYNDETELTAEVEPGKNTIDFTLESEPGEKANVEFTPAGNRST